MDYLLGEDKHMGSQNRWFRTVLLGGATVIVIAIIAVIMLNDWGHRELHGPVAVVRGNPPTHGFLGIEFDPQIPTPLTILSIVNGTGADEAGIQAGDVILAVETMANPGITEIVDLVKTRSPGDELTMKIKRGTDELELRVTLISFAEMIQLRELDRLDVVP